MTIFTAGSLVDRRSRAGDGPGISDAPTIFGISPASAGLAASHGAASSRRV